MQWLKRLFGIKSPIEKKKDELSKLQEKAFQAQRNGDLRLAGQYYHKAEALETEIVKMMEPEND